MGVCTTRQWQTHGRLVKKLLVNVRTRTLFLLTFKYILVSSVKHYRMSTALAH